MVYKASEPPGPTRVASLKILCTRCRVPKLESVVEARYYNIITTRYVAQGGSGYVFGPSVRIEHHGELEVHGCAFSPRAQ